MSFNVIRVSVFGISDPAWADTVRWPDARRIEADDFDIETFPDDSTISEALVRHRPQVIATFGAETDYPNLLAEPLEWRKRWINFPDRTIDPGEVADALLGVYLTNVTTRRFPDEPLVSIFTPTYRTGDKIERPLRSLLAQTYTNWEWVIYDDSPDDETFAQMSALADLDARINVFRAHRYCGSIGEVKRRATGLCRGDLFVELDHDDELTPWALRSLVDARNKHPEAGFFYSDFAEIFDDGENATYGPSWGFGYGSYRDETFRGHTYRVTNSPNINAKTIRHITSAPNHFRAWTREGYHAAGGHSPDVHVCDDYELMVRTFLTTPIVHIRRFGYIQYLNRQSTGNTQRHRNREIQRLTRMFMLRYNDAIHRRFIELGVDDFIANAQGGLYWQTPNPSLTPMANIVFD